MSRGPSLAPISPVGSQVIPQPVIMSFKETVDFRDCIRGVGSNASSVGSGFRGAGPPMGLGYPGEYGYW